MLAAAFMQQRSVGNFLNKRMAKCKQPLFEGRHIVKQLGSPQMPDGFGQLGLG